MLGFIRRILGFGEKEKMLGKGNSQRKQGVEERAREQVRNENVSALEEKIAKYEKELRALDDDLDRCKRYMADLETEISKKTGEYEKLAGGRKKIVGGQLRSLLKQRERSLGEPSVIQEKIDSLNVLVASAREALAGIRGAKISDDAETISVVHSAVKDELEHERVAVQYLDQTSFGYSSVDEIDSEEDDELESLLSAYREETEGSKGKANQESAAREKLADVETEENLSE